MEKQDLYLVKRDGEKTTLFCVFSREMEVPRKYTFHEENAIWVYAKELEEVLTHRDQFPEYVEISADEATKIMEMLNSENAKKEEEKNVIRVTHKQIEIQNEIVDIDIYRKDAKRRRFREQDLEKLLMDLINADHMVIQNIEYSQYDYWGYLKWHDVKSKEDIADACDMPQEINGYFTDDKRKYSFRYQSGSEIVKVVSCPKDFAVDLKTVFDDGSRSRTEIIDID